MSDKATYRGRVAASGSVYHGGHHFRFRMMSPDLHNQVDDWCEAHFGPEYGYDDRRGRWCSTGTSWVVYGDDDAMVFRLRWC